MLSPPTSLDLKYERCADVLGSLVPGISDARITAIDVHPEMIVLGTSIGDLSIYNTRGERTHAFLHAHSVGVGAVSIDAAGGAVVSSSTAFPGTPGEVLTTVTRGGDTGGGRGRMDIEATSPVTAVRIDPAYSQRRDKLYAVGTAEGRVTVRRRGWLTTADTVLHAGRGSVSSSAWRGTLLAWTDATGIMIADPETGEKVWHYDAPSATGPVSLAYETESSLVCGWGDCVMLVSLAAAPPGSSRTASVAAQWRVSAAIIGVSPFDRDHVALLCAPSRSTPPELVIAARVDGRISGADAIELSGDPLSLQFSNGTGVLGDAHVSWLHADLRGDHESTVGPRGPKPGSASMASAASPVLFLAAGSDLVVGRAQDADDRVERLLRKRQFAEARRIGQESEHLLQRNTVVELSAKSCPDTHPWVGVALSGVMGRRGAIASLRSRRRADAPLCDITHEKIIIRLLLAAATLWLRQLVP